MLVYVRPWNEAFLRARVPGARGNVDVLLLRFLSLFLQMGGAPGGSQCARVHSGPSGLLFS